MTQLTQLPNGDWIDLTEVIEISVLKGEYSLLDSEAEPYKARIRICTRRGSTFTIEFESYDAATLARDEFANKANALSQDAKTIPVTSTMASPNPPKPAT